MNACCSFVIVAAGRGERFGDRAKVLLPVAGRSMIAWSIDAANAAESVAEIVIVSGEHTIIEIQTLIAKMVLPKPVAVVIGGATRQESVSVGVAACSAQSAIVSVHDAARPLVTPELIDRCVVAANQAGGAIVAAPVTDTLKRVTDHIIDRTIARDHLWAAQTPQSFRREVIVAALAWAREKPPTHTDEASIVEGMGLPVAVVEGSSLNMKVTHPEDIAIADAFLSARMTGGLG